MKRNTPGIAFCNIMLISSLGNQRKHCHRIITEIYRVIRNRNFRYKNADPFMRKRCHFCLYIYYAFIIVNYMFDRKTRDCIKHSDKRIILDVNDI